MSLVSAMTDVSCAMCVFYTMCDVREGRERGFIHMPSTCVTCAYDVMLYGSIFSFKAQRVKGNR